jgi:protoheme IX farnesyltransferase
MNPPNEWFAMETFRYSIIYLMALFAFLLVDHYLAEPLPMKAAPAVFTFEKVGG